MFGDILKKIVKVSAILLVAGFLFLNFGIHEVHAAIAHDVTTEFPTSGTGGCVTSGSCSFTHTPSGTPRGVLIYVYYILTDTDPGTTVTYGGVSVPAVSSGSAADTVTEKGRVTAYYLGAGISTGAQTIVVTRTGTTAIYITSTTVTSATVDTEVTGTTLQQENGTIAQSSITDGSPGTNSVRFHGCYSGATSITAGASSTLLQSFAISTTAFAASVRETTAGQGARSSGCVAVTDDRAVVSLAVREKIITVSGTANGNNGATVRVAVNATLTTTTPANPTIASSAWTFVIPTPTANDIITVWVDAVADDLETTAVTKYSSGLTVSGMVLNTGVVSVGSNQNTSVTVTNMGLCDADTGCANEDVMFTSNSGALLLASSTNSDTLSVLASNTLTLTSASSETISTELINNAGTITATSTPTITLTGTTGTLFTNSGTFNAASSTVQVTSASGTPTLLSASTTLHILKINSAATIINLGANFTTNNNSGNKLWIASGVLNNASFTITPGTSGTFQIDSGGAFCLGGTLGGTSANCLSGASSTTAVSMPAFTTFTFDAASTVRYLSDAATTISASPTYGNLELSPKFVTTARIYTTDGAATLSVAGNLNINPDESGASAPTLTVDLGASVSVTGRTTITVTNSALAILDLKPSASQYNLTTGDFRLTTGGTLDAGSTTSTITLTGTSGTLFQLLGGTFTQGTSTVTMSGNGDATINSGSPTFYNLTSSGTGTKSLAAGITLATSGTLTVSGGIFNPATFLVTGSGSNTLAVSSGATVNVDASTFTDNYSAGFGTLTLNSASTTNYNLAGAQTVSGTPGYGNLTISGSGTKTLGGTTTVAGNLTVSAGTFQLADQSITVTGTSSITGTIDDNNTTGTNIFIGNLTVNNGGTWTSTGNESYEFRGGLDANSTSTFTSGSGTYTFSTNAQTVDGTQSITITNISNTITSGNGLTFSDAGITVGTLTQGTNAVLTFSGTVPTITTLTATASPNTVQYTGATQTIKGTTYHHLTINGSGTATLGGDTIANGTVTVTAGTLDTDNSNNRALTANDISIANSASAILTARASTITLTGTGTVFSVGASGVINAGTSTIKLSETTGSATAKTFAGGGKTYNNIWFAAATSGTSTGSVTITGSNTFADFKDDNNGAGAAHSILFTNGTTTTVTTFTVSGTSGNLITINSSDNSNTHTLSDSSGTNSLDYLNIQHSVATGGAEWYAGANSTNNNSVATAGSGWVFTAPPLNIIISTSSTTCGGTAPNYVASSSCVVNTTTIAGYLDAGTSVSFTTTNGNITVSNAIAKTAGGNATISMYASGNIIVSASISSTTGTLGILMNADRDANTSGYVNIAAALTSLGGNITMGGGSGTISAGTGFAVGNSGQATGVLVNGVTVAAGGGNVIVNGQGYSTTTNGNYGIRVTGASGAITTTGSGTINIKGTAAGTTNSASNYGLYVDTGGIISTVSGNLTILNSTGGGAGTGTDNYGVYITGANSTIKSTGASGNISVTGTGGNGSGSGGFNPGVYCGVANCIQATSTGTVTVIGTGSDSSGGFNFGIYVTGSVTGSGGSMTITGTGGHNSGIYNNGIVVEGSGIGITNSGNGTINMTGTARGTGDGSGNIGLKVSNGAVISTANGDLTITGTGGGAGSGTNNFGMEIKEASTVKTTGTGNLIITGIRGGGNTSNNYGAAFATANALQTTGSGNITINIDTVYLAETDDVNSIGTLTIAPYTASSTIGVAGGTGTLALSSTYLGYLTYATSLQIGNSSQTGTTTVGVYASWAKPISFVVNASGAIAVSGAQTNSSTFSFTGPTTLSADITSTTLTIVSGAFNAGSQTINLTGTGSLFLNSGTFTAGTSTIKYTNNSATGKTFAGGGGTYNNFWFAPSTGTGTLTITGTNTFADFKSDGTGAHTIVFPAGVTTTITSLTLDTDSAQLITLQSSSPGSYWNLVDTAGSNTVSYVSITDSCASGGATWTATDGTNVNGGHNCGWIFIVARYWVGGTADWDGTVGTKWATSSGGTGGASIPDSTMSAYFDASSGAVTVTIASGNTGVKDLIFTGFTGTLAGSTAISVSRALTLGAGMTNSYTGAITFDATSGTKSITSNGKSFGGNIIFNGTGGTWQPTDTLTTTGNLTLTNGTFSGNSQTVALTGTSQTITGGFTFYNLTRTGTASMTDSLTLANNQTITNTLTLSGNSATNRVLIQSNTLGTARTLTAATVSLTNVDFMDITGAGAASPFTGTSLGNALGNSGITFTGATTRYWVGGTGNWSDTGEWSASSGGSSGASVPLPQDSVIFNANSFNAGSQTATADMPRLGADINFTGVTNSPTFDVNSSTMYGSLTLGSGMSAGGNTFTMAARSSVNITSNGVSTTWGPWNISTYGGTVTLQDALVNTNGNGFNLNYGTFNANNQNVTLTKFISNNSATRTVTMGSGLWTITGTGFAWNTDSTLTINANTSTIKFTDTSSSTVEFYTSDKTYNNIWFARGASTGNNAIYGSNTFNEFKDTGTAAHNLLFAAGTTQTITTWTVSGTAGNLITINTNGSTQTHTLSMALVGVSADYLNIQHSVATGGASWYAGANSTNNQAVADAGSGWIFTVPPARSLTITTSSTSNAGTAPNWIAGIGGGNVNITDVQTQLNAGTSISFTGAVDITVSNAFTKSSGAAAVATFYADRNIIVSAAMSSSSGTLGFVLNADRDADSSGYVNIAGGMTSLGGDIKIGGGSGTISAGTGFAVGNSGQAQGVYVNGAAVAAGGGNVIVNGQGYNSSSNFNFGVDVNTAGSISTTGSGTIAVYANGSGNTNSASNFGLYLENGGNISSVNGNLTVNATGGGAGSGTGNYGVYILDTNSSIKTTGSGNISVTGTGGNAGGTGNQNEGVICSVANCIQTTSTGTISVTGTGSTSSGGTNEGIFVNTPGSITASGGAMTIVGTGGNSSGNGNYGIRVAGAAALISNTGSGTISITGNGTGNTNSGSNYGISVDTGGVISTVNGNLTVNNSTGGGAGTGTTNYGVYITGTNSTIKTTGSGNISVTGTGGNTSGSGGSNYGVYCNIANCIQATSTGTISVTGTGGHTSGSGTNNYGVYVATSSSITGAGGAMTILGTGGNSSSNGNVGVRVYGASALISNTGSGTISVTGNGGGITNSASNYGLEVGFGGIISTVNGNLTIANSTGGGAGSGTDNLGVRIGSTNTTIKTTGSGNVSVTGTGGNASGSGGVNYGLYCFVTSCIQAPGGGTISVTGAGGNGSGSGSSNIGLGIDGSITGTGGAMTIVGTGGNSSGNNNHGIWVASETSNTGSGTLSMTGTGRGNTNSNNSYGLYVSAGAIISTADGNTTVVGTGGGAGSGINNYGVYVTGAGGTIKTTGSGSLAVSGIRGGGDTATNYGTNIAVANGLQTTSTGNITVNTDTILLAQSNNINSAGTLTIAPYTAAGTVGVAGGAGTLGLTSTFLSYLTYATSLQIGNSSQTGATTLGAYASWAKPISFVVNASGAIAVSGAQTNSSAFSFTGPTTLTADITSTTLTIVSGTFIAGSQTITLTGTGSLFSNSGTFTAGTSTIKYTDSSATGKTFAGGGQTYYNFWYAPGTGTGTLTISGSNTFTDFKDNGTIAHSILFTTGTTQNFTTFTVSGNVGQLITINSTDTGTHALVKVAGTSTVDSDYLNIQHSIATPGGTWSAGDNSTNNQSVASAGSGWFFVRNNTYRGGGSGNVEASATPDPGVGGGGVGGGGGGVEGGGDPGGGQGGGGSGGGGGDIGFIPRIKYFMQFLALNSWSKFIL
ncbi:MAG: hypothetical protein M3Q34_02475 [bacterium]|nr:hypothetical protein [bacterium]